MAATVTPYTLDDYIRKINSADLRSYLWNLENQVAAGEIPMEDFTKTIKSYTGSRVNPVYTASGEQIIAFEFVDEVADTVVNPINSNEVTITRAKTSLPFSTRASQAGKAAMTRLAGVGSKTLTVLNKVAWPIAAAQVGCFLGKTIDGALYNANPDYWDSIGFSTLNPETWSSFIYSDPNAPEYMNDFLYFITGIDPNTNEARNYMNADAMAYMAYCMQQAGFFAEGASEVTSCADTTHLIYPIPFGTNNEIGGYYLRHESYWSTEPINNSSDVKGLIYRLGASEPIVGAAIYFSENPFDVATYRDGELNGTGSARKTTYNGNTYYYRTTGISIPMDMLYIGPELYDFPASSYTGEMAYALFNGIIHEKSGMEGVGNQPNAVLPNFDGLTQDQYLPYLRQQYPDAFNDAITYPVIQDDGSVKEYTYVPVPWVDSKSAVDTQPVTSQYGQQSPDYVPSTATDPFTQFLTDLLQQYITENDTPPSQPTDTGEGSSPVPIAPVGNSSSLWKVYHPTQGQIDSFGAWLWSPNFVDQLLKMFNNPMEAIIGLHKVYATPIDAGTATIKVGYLDSQVPSAYVDQQYIDINCGSVTIGEQYGNTLDYTATTIKLYLPFVGIVPLDVSEVMRSTISIVYGVDVFTGACLARVTIERDSNSAILYQYAGNCSVQYPLSSGSYMGVISSIIGIAGSVAATVASGGSAAPLALGAIGAGMGAHTSVQNSGSFSGNSGAMGGKIPYVIIERYQSKLYDAFGAMEGTPTNEYVTIGDCSGYVKARAAHIINVSATDEELTMIQDTLMQGIIC